MGQYVVEMRRIEDFYIRSNPHVVYQVSSHSKITLRMQAVPDKSALLPLSRRKLKKPRLIFILPAIFLSFAPSVIKKRHILFISL